METDHEELINQIRNCPDGSRTIADLSTMGPMNPRTAQLRIAKDVMIDAGGCYPTFKDKHGLAQGRGNYLITAIARYSREELGLD